MNIVICKRYCITKTMVKKVKAAVIKWWKEHPRRKKCDILLWMNTRVILGRGTWEKQLDVAVAKLNDW